LHRVVSHCFRCRHTPRGVEALTERLRADGYRILSEPRLTGDGFYESSVADPVEIVAE
jgi:hypothetical protein